MELTAWSFSLCLEKIKGSYAAASYLRRYVYINRVRELEYLFKIYFMKNYLLLLVLAIFSGVLHANAQEVMPNIAVSNIPVLSISDLSNGGSDQFVIMKSVSATSDIYSDNNKKSRVIWEKNGEFKVSYQRKVIDNKAWLIYDDSEGIIRLGYLGGIVSSNNHDYFYAEEIVRRLAIYRLINIAREYGADAVLSPTIVTRAIPIKKDIEYVSEISAKLIKVKSN